jgi:hypothetical protein
VSEFAVFERDTNRNLGEGKTQEEAYVKACATLKREGVSNDRIAATMVEWVHGDRESWAIFLYP